MWRSKFFAFWFLGFLVVLALPSAAAVNVSGLRCEQLEHPRGIDVLKPRLSWLLESDQSGVRQTAYQILVASSKALLAQDQADLWDSGQVKSAASVLVAYAGKPLVSRASCFWKIRIWDEAGQVSAWSPTSLWTMGILHPEEWRAKWIGQDELESTNYLSGTSWIWSRSAAETNYFRRLVVLPAGRPIKRAIFEYTGDSECRGWIDHFDLGARNNFKTVKWNDITGRIEPGQSYVFGLTGRHVAKGGNSGGVIGRLSVEFSDGSVMLVPTDETWLVSSNAPSQWNSTSFDPVHWEVPKILGPAGALPWGGIREPEDRRLPARYLRREFSVNKAISRATISLCGLGLSELYLNGGKVGDSVLSPAFSQYDRREFYVTYDVTANLRPGANALGVILGNGRFFADRSKVYAGTVNFGWPKLLLNLLVEFADGTSTEIVSDQSWQLTTGGPILANNDFDGEEYDARREFPGWAEPGFSGVNWSAAQIVSAPGGVLSAQMMQPIRVTDTIRPLTVKEIKPGVFIYDLGQNMVGWCRLTVAGPPGTAITLRHAETLKPDGSLYMANLRGAQARDVFTLKGGGVETWEPRFVTHGFRYVELTGFPGKPGLDSLAGRVVNDDLPSAGDFRCSNDLLNRIYTNILWGTRGNYRSLPTDCPQRDERQGWLGDRSEECKGESYLFDIAPLYAKWRQDMADAQRADGVIPDVAPAYWPIYSDNVTWPSSAIIVLDALQRQFGDAAGIRLHYAGAKSWMQHMLGLATNHLLSKDNYGDWCVPPEEPSLIHSLDPAKQTDKTLLASTYFYYDLCLMAKYATQLGQAADAEYWRDHARAFKTAINQTFLNRQQGQYSNGTQTSCVLPLAFGLVPEDMQNRVFAHLVDKIENETHGHIGTGLIGGQYLNRVLSDHGRADLSYRIAGQKDYPSWGYMVGQGATTIWELWNGNTADPTMNSGNHVMLIGDLVLWFYEYLAGIAPDDRQPGFKHLVMQPHPVGDLTFVRASHRSPYGWIYSEWHRDGDRFDWQVEIPANTTATIMVPAGKAGRVFQNGKPVPAKLEMGSGKYHFTSEISALTEKR